MKAFLYILAALFTLVALGSTLSAESAIHQGVAGVAWGTAMVCLGAAAICGRIDAARTEEREREDDRRRTILTQHAELLAALKAGAPRPEIPAAPKPAEWDAAGAVDEMLRIRSAQAAPTSEKK